MHFSNTLPLTPHVVPCIIGTATPITPLSQVPGKAGLNLVASNTSSMYHQQKTEVLKFLTLTQQMASGLVCGRNLLEHDCKGLNPESQGQRVFSIMCLHLACTHFWNTIFTWTERHALEKKKNKKIPEASFVDSIARNSLPIIPNDSY